MPGGVRGSTILIGTLGGDGVLQCTPADDGNMDYVALLPAFLSGSSGTTMFCWAVEYVWIDK